MAHEWQHSGAVEALQPWIDAGQIKLYCPESNVSVAWTGEGDPAWRLAQHARYERFITEDLVRYIREDCATPEIKIATTGCSFGAYYAVNTALKHPDKFHYALGMSGRYRPETFLDGYRGPELYMHHPMAHVSGLSGEPLSAAQGVEVVLVAGQGNFEGNCTHETREMASVLKAKGIPATLDVWGHDVSHEWVWWRRQLLHHLGRKFS
jgi:esterase/lipase superfamily enzyme